YAALEEEKNSAASIRAAVTRRQRAARRSLWRWILSPAAALALALGAFHIGTRYAPSAPAPAPVAASDSETKRELAEMRQKLESIDQLVGISLLQQRSTSERLQTVLASL